METVFDNVPHVEVILGPISSSNSKELLNLISCPKYSGKECVVVKYINNGHNEEEQYISHDNRSLRVIYASALSSIIPKVKGCDVIGIDEGHLFGDIDSFSDDMANNGKIVLVVALDGDSEGKLFENIRKLIPKAEMLRRPLSICNDGEGRAASSNVKSSDSGVGIDNDPHIETIIGSMFSGKTSEMLESIGNYENKGKKGLVVRHPKDTRIVPKGQHESLDTLNEPIVLCVSQDNKYSHEAIVSSDLSTILEKTKEYPVVGIDEGQFFDNILEICRALVKANKIVLVSGIDGDYLRNPFGHILDLISISTKINKRNAVCKCCGRPASFSFRKGFEKDTVRVGGGDEYYALCRFCFWKCMEEKRQYESSSPKEGSNLNPASNGDIK